MKRKTQPSDAAALRAISRGEFKDCYLIYNRKSTDDADSQKNSIVYQGRENRRFAKRSALPVAQLTIEGFCTNGVISEKHSGFKESGDLTISTSGVVQYKIDRPKFQKLLRHLNEGHFKGIICLSWDRLSRNQGDDTVLRKLKRNGTDLQFAYANYDKSSAGELHMDIDGMFAQHHSRVTSEKVRLAIRTNRENGKWTHRAPIGYLNEGSMDHKPLDPERAPIIKELFELYATGDWSLSDLARYATKQGLTTVPTRSPRTLDELLADDADEAAMRPKQSRPLAVNHLSKMLRNRFYVGEVIGPEGAFVPSNCHEPLIDKKTFSRVQAQLGTRRTSIHYTDKLDHPFRGFVRCAKCDRVYTPYEKKGILYFNVRCTPNCSNRMKNCNAEHICGLIAKLLGRLELSDADRDLLNARTDTEVGILADEHQRVEERNAREIKRLRESLTYLRTNQLELLKAGTYTPYTLAEEQSQLQTQIAEIRDRDAINDKALQKLVEEVLRVSELSNMARNLFELANLAEKEAIAKDIFSELSIDENTLEFKPQPGFGPLLKRENSVSGATDWFSEYIKEPDIIALAVAALNNTIHGVMKQQ